MKQTSFSVRNMVYCAICAALMAVCAWLSVPAGAVVFTMQTFAVFLALGLLGGRRGTVAVLVYLFLGSTGLPVFSGFRGGLGVLLGITGGYIWGFLAAALVYWMLERLPGSKLPAMILGMAVCYTCGTVWYLHIYGGTLWAVLMTCVVPYLIPDALKIGLALSLSGRLKRIIN